MFSTLSLLSRSAVNRHEAAALRKQRRHEYSNIELNQVTYTEMHLVSLVHGFRDGSRSGTLFGRNVNPDLDPTFLKEMFNPHGADPLPPSSMCSEDR
jgi:hypothetical protein